MVYTALMKRKKRRSRTKAEIITAVLYGIFALLVAGGLYGAGRGAYALMGETVGNHYYATLAEKFAPADTVDFAELAKINPEVCAWVRGGAYVGEEARLLEPAMAEDARLLAEAFTGEAGRRRPAATPSSMRSTAISTSPA